MMGPSKAQSTQYVKKRLIEGCKTCERCGEKTHYVAAIRPGCCPTINIGGRIMAVRRAAWIALIGKPIKDGKMITSTCSNQNCINPKMMIQADPGEVLALHYTVHNSRSRYEATAHLMKYTRQRTKLSADDVVRIRSDNRKGKAAASEFGISKEHYNAIQRGQSRITANPFSGLGAR